MFLEFEKSLDIFFWKICFMIISITSHDYFLLPNKPIYGLCEAYTTSNAICIVLILLYCFNIERFIWWKKTYGCLPLAFIYFSICKNLCCLDIAHGMKNGHFLYQWIIDIVCCKNRHCLLCTYLSLLSRGFSKVHSEFYSKFISHKIIWKMAQDWSFCLLEYLESQKWGSLWQSSSYFQKLEGGLYSWSHSSQAQSEREDLIRAVKMDWSSVILFVSFPYLFSKYFVKFVLSSNKIVVGVFPYSLPSKKDWSFWSFYDLTAL
jgi:hypothetical protein